MQIQVDTIRELELARWGCDERVLHQVARIVASDDALRRTLDGFAQLNLATGLTHPTNAKRTASDILSDYL